MGACKSKINAVTPQKPEPAKPEPAQDETGTVLDPTEPKKDDSEGLLDPSAKPQDDVAEATEALADAAGDLVDVVQEKVEDAAEVVVDTIQEAAEAVGEHVKDLAEAGYDAAESAAVSAEQAVAEAVVDARDAVAARLEPVLEPVERAAEAVAQTVSRARDEIVEDAQAVGEVAAGIARTLEPVTRAFTEVAAATAKVIGAAAVAVGVVVGEAVFPTEEDTTVTMIPYFKISPSNLDLWKAQCDKFYEVAEKNEGMLFYAFYYHQDGDKDETGEIHIRQGFKDANSLVEHLRNIDVPLQLALQLSQLERVEIFAPPSQLEKIKAVQSSLGDKYFEFYEQTPESVRRTTRHTGTQGADRTVSFSHYFDVVDSTVQVPRQLGEIAAGVAAKAREAPGVEHVSFAFSADRVHLHQGFRDADAAVRGLADGAPGALDMRAMAALSRVEVHGRAEELARLRALVSPEALEQIGPNMYARDARSVRRTYLRSEKTLECADFQKALAEANQLPELVSATPRLQQCNGWGCC